VSGNTATFTPSATLAGSTQFTATITTAARDAAGNPLASNFIWTFTTAAAPDVTPPTVTARVPAIGATGVSVGTTVSATFSEAMQNATLTTSSFTLATTSGGVAVSGSVSVSSNTATFTPGAALAAGTQYTATVTTAAKDLAGNSLAANVTWNFTTASSGGGGSPSLGAHAVAFKFDGATTVPVSTPSLTTQASGSTIVACVGREQVSAHSPPTDNKGNTYVQIGTSHTYTNFPSSGTACYVATNAVGGANHIVTALNNPGRPNEETTLSVVEVINGSRVQDQQWNNDLTSPYTTSNVTTTGPATIIAVWWGEGLSGHIATPNNSFTVIHSVLQDGNLVQVATAVRTVTAAGTYNVTWTSNEGAQLWIIAIQP
jgi:hypothetical protein